MRLIRGRQRQATALLLLVALGGFTAALLRQIGIRQDLQEELDATEQQTTQIQQQTLSQLTTLQEELSVARTDLEEATTLFPEGGIASSELGKLFSSAIDTGVKVLSMAATTTEETSGGGGEGEAAQASAASVTYRKLSFSLQLAGDLSSLTSFLTIVDQRTVDTLLMEDVQITRAGGAGYNGTVNVTLFSKPAAQAPTGEQFLPPQAELTQQLQKTVEKLNFLLDQAWTAEDWPQALDLIDQIQAIDPQYGDLETKEYAAHYNYGRRLEKEGDIEGAIEQYSLALAVKPDGDAAAAALRRLSGDTTGPGPGAPPAVSAGGEVVYITQRDDTLFKIAKQFGTTPEAIIQRNGLTSRTIHGGRELRVPVPAGSRVHTVVEGETWGSIGAQYGTTAGHLQAVNALVEITPGTRLLILPNTLEIILYRVQGSDSLATIAQTYGTSVDRIQRLNNTTTVAPGDIIYVPTR